MRVAITTSVSVTSAKELAQDLKNNGIDAVVFRPYKQDVDRTFPGFTDVFCYGCSAQVDHQNVTNRRSAVLKCVDKVKTFQTLNALGLSTVRWWVPETVKHLPKDVEVLVVRGDRKGKKAEDFSYWYKENKQPLPPAELYTEYYDHKWEYRVTYFRGHVFVYWKQYNPDDGMHEFVLQRLSKYPKMVDECTQAAIGLGIDYVSFDVVAKSREDFAILEANSGSILTDEVSTAIVEYYLNK